MTRTGSHPLDPVRTHRRLVRLGYALLAAGPVLALAHLITTRSRPMLPGGPTRLPATTSH